jgi:hypothetical protein
MATWLETQITDTQDLIEKVTAAISAVLVGGHQSYEIDTGQSNQGVKRLSLEQLRKFRTQLYIDLQDLQALNGDIRAGVTMKADF